MINRPMNTRTLSCALIAVLALGGCGGAADQAAPDPAGATEAAPGAITAAQIARLGIRTEPARDAGPLPLGTVPAQVTLPPEARVAVTAPFAGALVRLFVIEGQEVSRGQALAVVRAAEPVQYGANLARARAELTLAQTRAARLGQLAREGVVAGARADEASAQLHQVQATIAENRRLLALGGASPDGTMTLRAPIAGRLAHVAVETGGPVGGMTAPFVIENTARYRLDLQLPERIARAVRPGMAVDVQVPQTAGGAPVIVSGKVLSVGASIDPATRSVLAKASIGGAPGLVSGQNLMAVIKGADVARGGVSVPSVAVTQSQGQAFVFVRAGNRFVRRKVAVVAEAGGRSVIGEGLTPGEPVAVSGVAELKSLLAE